MNHIPSISNTTLFELWKYQEQVKEYSLSSEDLYIANIQKFAYQQLIIEHLKTQSEL